MMHAPRAAAVFVSALLLAACGKQAPPPAPPAPLSRPTLALAAQAGRILVPQAALVERGGIPGVFVLADGQARFRMVRPGKSGGGRVEILSGLDGNEILVLGDLNDVHDGSTVTPAPSAK